ncbi:MAG: tRNA isopentenyl-2-thiomethyl-A-37 hydroxylase MiaE [Candidatus Scalindua sp.]
MKNITVGTILKKAAKNERELYLLYKNAERRVKDDRIRTILKRFAREELEHEQTIKNFNIDGLKKQKIEIKKIPQQVLLNRLNGRSLNDYSDFEDVLIYATKLEKKAFEFYSNLSKCVDNSDLKKLFIRLSQEESRHREDIEDLFWDVAY